MLRDKTEQLISYIIHKSERNITSLMKLIYLIDLVSVRKNKQQISDFKYKRYFYGPFDREIYNITDSLIENKILEAERFFTKDNLDGEFIIYKYKSSKDPVVNLLSADELQSIDEVLNSLVGYGAKKLTELAYETKPMKALEATLGGDENFGKDVILQ